MINARRLRQGELTHQAKSRVSVVSAVVNGPPRTAYICLYTKTGIVYQIMKIWSTIPESLCKMYVQHVMIVRT